MHIDPTAHHVCQHAEPHHWISPECCPNASGQTVKAGIGAFHSTGHLEYWREIHEVRVNGPFELLSYSLQ